MPPGGHYSHLEGCAEEKGKDKFVSFKERATNIDVETVGEVFSQVPQTSLQELRLIAMTTKGNHTLNSSFLQNTLQQIAVHFSLKYVETLHQYGNK